MRQRSKRYVVLNHVAILKPRRYKNANKAEGDRPIHYLTEIDESIIKKLALFSRGDLSPMVEQLPARKKKQKLNTNTIRPRSLEVSQHRKY